VVATGTVRYVSKEHFTNSDMRSILFLVPAKTTGALCSTMALFSPLVFFIKYTHDRFKISNSCRLLACEAWHDHIDKSNFGSWVVKDNYSD